MPNSNHLRFFQLSCRMIFLLRWCCVNHINHVVICTCTSATWYTGIYILWSAVLLTSHSETQTPKNSLISFENHHEHRRPHPIGPLKMTWENHCCSDAKNQKEHRKAAICSPGAIKGHPGAGGSGMVWTSPDYSRASELVEGRICRAPLFFVAAKNPGSLWFPVRFSNLFHQPIHWQHDFAAFPYSARATSPAQELELVLPPGRSATNGSETFWNWRICRLKKPFYRNLILL